MRNKAPLPLMEQLVMVLVFALTAAVCLRGFYLADRTSRLQEARDRSVILVQNAAELLKHTSGNFSDALDSAGGFLEDSVWYIPYDESWQTLSIPDDAVYLLQVTPIDTENPFLGSAHIKVTYKQYILFEITTAWQEVNKNEAP